MATAAAISLFLAFAVAPANASASDQRNLSDEDHVASVVETAADSADIDTSMDVALTPAGEALVAQTPEAFVTILGSEGEPTVISNFDDVEGAGSFIILPENSDGSLQVSEDGVGVVEPSQEDPDVAHVIHPTEEGSVRVESVISSKDAPECFDYTFPGVDRIEIYEDQEVVWLLAIDKEGDEQLVGIVDAAWAEDANGVSVPTYFEAEGNVLTQVVEHQSGEFAYPIVADPEWWNKAVKWANKAASSTKTWLKTHVTWSGTKRIAGKSGKFFTKKVAPGAAVLCAVGAGWAWYRSDASGWVRVGDVVVGCIA